MNIYRKKSNTYAVLLIYINNNNKGCLELHWNLNISTILLLNSSVLEFSRVFDLTWLYSILYKYKFEIFLLRKLISDYHQVIYRAYINKKVSKKKPPEISIQNIEQ